MALSAKPPDCGQDSLVTGPGKVTLRLAESLSGSISRRSAKTETRSPGSGTLDFSNQSHAESDRASRTGTTRTLERVPTRWGPRSTVGIDYFAPFASWASW